MSVLNSPFRQRALRAALAGVLLQLAAGAHAVGLANIVVQSHLGQPLRATVDVLGADSEETLRPCVRARLLNMDGALLMTPVVTPVRQGGAIVLQIVTTQKVLEPAVSLTVEISCEGSTQREYALLLDPVEWQPVPAAAPVAVPAANGVQMIQRDAPRPVAQGVPLPGARASAARTAARAPTQSAAAPRPARARAAEIQPVKPSQKADAGPTRNVLRLSTSDVQGAVPADDTEQKLKAVRAKLLALESNLGAAPGEPAKSVDTQTEPVEFAASLDQTEQKLKEVQARIRALQIETNSMSSRELSQKQPVTPKVLPVVPAPAPPPPESPIGPMAMLGLALAVVAGVGGWLLLRMRRMNRYRDQLD